MGAPIEDDNEKAGATMALKEPGEHSDELRLTKPDFAALLSTYRQCDVLKALAFARLTDKELTSFEQGARLANQGHSRQAAYNLRMKIESVGHIIDEILLCQAG